MSSVSNWIVMLPNVFTDSFSRWHRYSCGLAWMIDQINREAMRSLLVNCFPEAKVEGRMNVVHESSHMAGMYGACCTCKIIINKMIAYNVMYMSATVAIHSVIVTMHQSSFIVQATKRLCIYYANFQN